MNIRQPTTSLQDSKQPDGEILRVLPQLPWRVRRSAACAGWRLAGKIEGDRETAAQSRPPMPHRYGNDRSRLSSGSVEISDAGARAGASRASGSAFHGTTRSMRLPSGCLQSVGRYRTRSGRPRNGHWPPPYPLGIAVWSGMRLAHPIGVSLVSRNVFHPAREHLNFDASATFLCAITRATSRRPASSFGAIILCCRAPTAKRAST